MNKNILSIKELNEMLTKLRNRKEPEITDPFAEIDIVFIAGLLLWYNTNKKKFLLRFADNSEYKPFTISEYVSPDPSIPDSIPEQKQKTIRFSSELAFYKLLKYLQQYQIIFNKNINLEIKCPTPNGINEIIKVQNVVKVDTVAENLPLSFVPILYINEETYDWLFGNSDNQKITEFKNRYINTLKEQESNKKEKNYFKRKKNITQELKAFPAVYTFIFSVAYHKIKPFVDPVKKKFNTGEYGVEKIWLFTQDYVRSLNELAKNIIEHSGKKGEKGKGMITIRAYSGDDKVLETHVFDYGEKGIIPKLIEYTKEKATNNHIKNPKIKKCYSDDNSFFSEKKEYRLKDYIENGYKLEQQKFRHTSHYGINNLYKLLKKKLNGEMYVSTNGTIDYKRDHYNKNAENPTLEIGTHYFFKIPFEPQNFKNITAKPFTNENQTATLGETNSLGFLSTINTISSNLDKFHEIPQTTENSLIDITINEDEITKENVEKIYSSLDYLISLKDNNKIAINLHDKINDASVLLRFLSHLTFEYTHPFIIYGINYIVYKDLLVDNKDFYESRKSYGEAYWHSEKAILLFLKTNRNFYFCDILFGQNRSEFLFVNKIVSHTFPNTITLLQELDDLKKQTSTNYASKISSNQNLQSFFYEKSNLLLPFDTLLKNKKELFFSNLKTILENDLIRTKTGYNNLNEYISNSDGYHISHTHFKIGVKIHSSDFYYAKRLFQNSFYTARLAMLLAMKIKTEINDRNKKILLIGYEMYSELLLSLIRKFLIDNEYKYIKHYAGVDNEGTFIFKPGENLFWLHQDTNLIESCIAIVIVPIASTGSTAIKIQEAIKAKARKTIKPILKKKSESQKLNKTDLETQIKCEIDKISFSKNLTFNVIIAQDENEKFKKLIQKGQENLITLKANWNFPEECKYCFGLKEEQNEIEEKNIEKFKIKYKATRALFGTDKSYLTPALIFDKPTGKIINSENLKYDKTSQIEFNEVLFKKSLLYKKVRRNNEFYLFSVSSPIFIDENNRQTQNKNGEITEWLEELNKEFFDKGREIKLKSTDRIILLAPCHETNSEFLNLVNEHVFNSSATIIHHQTDVDYIENFKLLNKELLGKENDNRVKVFYVDDNLISGKQFFEIYHLFRDAVGGKKRLSGAILLRDSSTQETHDRFVRAVTNCRVFVAYNLPPSLSFDSKKPLEHERKRYEDLRKFALHDVLIKIFDEKELELNVEEKNKISNRERKKIDAEALRKDFPEKFKEYQVQKEEEKTREKERKIAEDEKEKRHLKAFVATHQVYDFFAKERILEKENQTLTGNKFESINLDTLQIEELQKECFNNDTFGKNSENRKSLMKVLTQYPFLLYKPLKEMSFRWHKEWLGEKIQNKFGNCFNLQELNSNNKEKKQIIGNIRQTLLIAFPMEEFRELKFLLRRGIFLENMQVIDKSFLQLIPLVFNKIKEKLDHDSVNQPSNELQFEKLCILEKDNLNDFQIFLVRNYLELTHKNGWAAVKLLENIKTIEDEFKTEAAKQFLRMLKIELAAVVNEFNNVIISQYEIEWRDIFKDSGNSLDISNKRIIDFFQNKEKEFLTKTKYVIALKILGVNDYMPLINYYWIKQLIFNETHPKSFIPQIDLQTKIKAIVEKVKGFFHANDSEAFFIVTDKQNEAYIVYDDNNHLRYFEGYIPVSYFETDQDKNTRWTSNKFKTINRILYGMPDIQKIAVESIKEYKKNEKGEWIDIYTNEKHICQDEKINFEFLPDDKNYLLLVRFSQFKDHSHKILGLMGFYCNDNSYDPNKYLLPKQLLMLLRQDIGEFIIKHHKNDEFSDLRQQIEKNKYIFKLNHGLKTYKYAIEEIIKNCDDIDLTDDLTTFFDYLITKLEIIDKLSSTTETEPISLQTIKDEFKNRYKKILSLKVNDAKCFSKNDIDKLVKINFNGFDNLNNKYDFPKNNLKDIVFELLNNIRKNVCNQNMSTITIKSQLKIDVSVINIGKNIFLEVTNNKVLDFDKPKSDDTPHGIDLLKELWRSHKIGKINVIPRIENQTFTIQIQLNPCQTK